jgi:hypothetical protein
MLFISNILNSADLLINMVQVQVELLMDIFILFFVVASIVCLVALN